MTRALVLVLIAVNGAFGQSLSVKSARGEQLFTLEHCVECHSVNGKGARTAPDLGRILDRGFTPASLASTMWNHAPAMWGAMRARNVQPGELDNQAAADLFAYFYSARFFESPGDAGRGKRLFTERSCAQCHGITEATNQRVPPLTQWQSLGDPIALTAAMWNHSAAMGAELRRRGIRLQEISAQDLTDLLVYLRNVPAAKGVVSNFETTEGLDGAKLFESKGCEKCHPAKTLTVARRLRGKTLTEVAAQMWDHGLRLPAATVRLEPAEMREVLSYVWAAQFFESSGDASRGKRVFTGKRCGTCHDGGASGAPPLTHEAHGISEITMVSALWRHGPTMLASMTQRKISWPRFDAREMSDLIAYLNTR